MTDEWRRVKPETLHITLAFLGCRPDEDVATISEIVQREAGGPAPKLTFNGVRAHRHVLTVELGHEGLGPLQQRLSQALTDAGVYTPETRPFWAHVTIGRLKPRLRAPRTPRAELAPLTCHGTRVTLYESRLHPHGARYEALATASLAAS